MKPRVMKNGTLVTLLMVILLAGTAVSTVAQPIHKLFMRGQVLDVEDGTAYICLGSEEGAKVGQEFNVTRYVRELASRGTYRIEPVGTVKITEVESHMARAKILTGDVKAHDVVDLK